MAAQRQGDEQQDVGEFARAFTSLLQAAKLSPDKLRRELARQHQPGLVARATLYDWMSGQHLPEDDAAFLAVVRTCLAFTGDRRTRPPRGTERDWLALLDQARRTRDAPGQHPTRMRHTAAPVRAARDWDPVKLGVHKAIGGDPLPAFVRRQHDDLLDAVMNPRVAANRLIVLRGGSSTGKSRSAYHAVSRGALAAWRLEYPPIPAELIYLLDGEVPSRTVLWLREFRDYADGDRGQEALARLIRLLDGHRHIIVITTMWRDFWDAYTADPRGGPGTSDPYTAARALLAGLTELTSTSDIDPSCGGVIDVPDVFSARDLA